MDTAQRGMGLDWPGALELIRRTKAELPDALVANGCGLLVAVWLLNRERRHLPFLL
jgi:hypothetical protein